MKKKKYGQVKKKLESHDPLLEEDLLLRRGP